jgi:aquaporin NIP
VTEAPEKRLVDPLAAARRDRPPPPEPDRRTQEPTERPSLLRRALAEALAVFALVFAGCGAIIANARYDGVLGTIGIAIAFALVVMTMICAVGHLSGAHMSPAVTVAFTVTRQLPVRDALAYVPAQFAGATGGTLVLLGVGTNESVDLAVTSPSVGVGAAFMYEAILTALLMFVVVAVTTDTRAARATGAIAIGGVIGLASVLGASLTGPSMNPARSFGPALIADEWHDYWIYALAPVVGAIVGALLYRVVRDDS